MHFIYHKNMKMDEELYNHIVERLKVQSYDTSELMKTLRVKRIRLKD